MGGARGQPGERRLAWARAEEARSGMTAKRFYDWQTAGGTDDVMRLVDALEGADIRWCAIGGIAVNHSRRTPASGHA